jgi:hypothetical protein
MAIPTIFRQPILNEKREITFILCYVLYFLGIAFALIGYQLYLFRTSDNQFSLFDIFLITFLAALFAFLPAGVYFLSVSFFRAFVHKILAFLIPLLILELLVLILTYLFIGSNYFYRYLVFFQTAPIFLIIAYIPLIINILGGIFMEYLYAAKSSSPDLLDDF